MRIVPPDGNMVLVPRDGNMALVHMGLVPPDGNMVLVPRDGNMVLVPSVTIIYWCMHIVYRRLYIVVLILGMVMYHPKVFISGVVLLLR